MISLLPLIAIASISTVDIRQYGAVGDGKTMCTQAIQKALDEAATAGKRVVVVPAGRYLTGSLHLKSHVELHIDKEAVLLGSPYRKDYDKGEWYSLILASKANDIAITGEGTIDGQGVRLAQDILRMIDTGEVKIPPNGWRANATDRPQILEIDDCRNVRIEGVTVKNAACWVQTYRRCSNLLIKGIKVDSKTYWNNDGIDVVDCRNVLITGCDVDSDDDGICLKSDDRKLACENVVIENCKVRSSASAIKFGTASHGGFRHIRIKGIDVRDTFRSAIALESVDGGILEDIVVEDVHAVNTGNAFFIRLGHRNLRVPPGSVRHVVLRNFDVQVTAGRPDDGYPFHGPIFEEPHNINPSSIVGHSEVPIEDVRLEHIKIRMPGGGNKAVAYRPLGLLDKMPERAEFYPEFSMFGELPAWALYMRHVRGLRILDLQVILDRPDYRPAFVADDVWNLKSDTIAVRGADPTPMLAVLQCKDVKVKGVQINTITWGKRLVIKRAGANPRGRHKPSPR